MSSLTHHIITITKNISLHTNTHTNTHTHTHTHKHTHIHTHTHITGAPKFSGGMIPPELYLTSQMSSDVLRAIHVGRFSRVEVQLKNET